MFVGCYKLMSAIKEGVIMRLQCSCCGMLFKKCVLFFLTSYCHEKLILKHFFFNVVN